jgi:hypothetical protein
VANSAPSSMALQMVAGLSSVQQLSARRRVPTRNWRRLSNSSTVASMSAIRSSSMSRTAAHGAMPPLRIVSTLPMSSQMQAEGAGTPDERQQLDIALFVEPIARWGSIGRCEQALGLIDSHRFAGDPGSRGGLPDRQSGCRHKPRTSLHPSIDLGPGARF